MHVSLSIKVHACHAFDPNPQLLLYYSCSIYKNYDTNEFENIMCSLGVSVVEICNSYLLDWSPKMSSIRRILLSPLIESEKSHM